MRYFYIELSKIKISQSSRHYYERSNMYEIGSFKCTCLLN